MLHARYLVNHHKTGHLEEDQAHLKTPMKRAEHFGDTGMGVYEVCWAGPSNDKKSIEASIYYFKTSPMHWYIMTEALSRFDKVRFGFAKLLSNSWNTCVIIYSVGSVGFN